ncbi:MAG: PQQ-binding-like beta-propeller repeat protein [Candidatus Hydrogenedentes bacterium]|nr:PQQ-binding-like beta-propeller repeat protein [Candidatus Hydrogenedentota bacterium]
MALALALCAALAAAAYADDWPTYRHDNRRSGVSADALKPAGLAEKWVYEAPAPPQPAWHGPAKWDPYAGIKGLRSMRNYDPVFYVSVAGSALFFGSSVEDAAYCLDAATGAIRWLHGVDGPVRIVPTCVDGRVYFGADDGFAYCLDAKDGDEIWRFSPTGPSRLVPNNGKTISRWPCRTGVLVDGGTAYFGMGLLPWHESYLCAVDAATGATEGPGRYCTTLPEATLEGAMLASPAKLYAPQGRSAPMVFNRSDGAYLGGVEGGGGVFALLTPDHQFAHGPGNKAGWITVSNAETRDKLASYDGGNCMVVLDARAYVLKNAELLAIDRATGEPVWKMSTIHPYTLILAGDVLFAGGADEVAAFAIADGAALATLPVNGRAYGLAAANGRLYVSTDTGAVHCFE